MFNRNAFRAKVVGAGMTLSGLASEIGISDASLNRKMSGKSDFTRLEIQHIRMVLRMTPDEADAIFLHQNLRKRKSGVKKQPADGGQGGERNGTDNCRFY